MNVLVDRKILNKYGGSFAEGFGGSYRLTIAESWDDLDRDEGVRLLNEGLELLRQHHINTHQPGPLDPTNPWDRLYYPALGFLAMRSEFTGVMNYLCSRDALQRLLTIEDLFLGLDLAAGDVKKRHLHDFKLAQAYASNMGHTLGMLAVLGEVPDHAE